MTTRKKHRGQFSFAAQFWNEVLFARKFEYESPLSPDELTHALKALEQFEQRAWILSSAKLKHKLEIGRDGDKSQKFSIRLYEGIAKAKDASFHLIEGRIRVDANSGMSIIEGETRFGNAYFLGWINIFALSLLFFFFSFSSVLWAFILLAIFYWLTMYTERNRLADRLDEIIMQAKSQQKLRLSEEKTLDEAGSLVESQRLKESE